MGARVLGGDENVLKFSYSDGCTALSILTTLHS